MKHEDKIIERYGRESGFSVPENYFETFYKDMSRNLPKFPEVPKPERLSAWHRIRPYVYMAAMFAGIWIMMKVFYHVGNQQNLNLDNPPQEIALAMADYDDYEVTDLDNFEADLDLMDETQHLYSSIDEFEKAFGYKFKPEYKDINVNRL